MRVKEATSSDVVWKLKSYMNLVHSNLVSCGGFPADTQCCLAFITGSAEMLIIYLHVKGTLEFQSMCESENL